jgi:hypothetical protein
MQDIEGGKSGESINQNTNLIEQGGIPHEKLVESFRGLIKEQQEVHAGLRSFPEYAHEPEVLSPERAVRSVLDWYAGSANKEMGEHMFTVRSAWDALSYLGFPFGAFA